MVWNIVIVIVALCFCALFSGYEMAFLHCNRLKVALDKKEGKKYAIAMDRFINNEGDLISSLLMGNNIFVVIFCDINFCSGSILHNCRRSELLG